MNPKRTILLHALVWAVFGYFEYFVYPDVRVFEGNLFFVLRMILFVGLFYYNSLFVYDFLFRRRSVLRGMLFLFAGMAVYGGLLYWLFHYFYYETMADRLAEIRDRVPDAERMAQHGTMAGISIVVIYYLALFFVSILYWLYRRVRITSAAAEKAEKERLKEENERVRAQNMFLRSQINPHFLHNTLNFLYAKALPLSAELSDGIMTLSNVMRYSLQNDEDSQGMVLLDREVEHLQNVIAIHQMRFSHSLYVDFSITGNTEGVKVIPLVFITLLENAFKHGVVTDAQYPLRIWLEVNAETVHFSTTNRKRNGPKEISHGIGIENIRRRLAYVYRSGYLFDIRDTETEFSVELVLPVSVPAFTSDKTTL